MTAVGLIGLGRMGLPIAERMLAAGYALHVWNRTAARAAPLAAQGAHVHPTPAAVAAAAEIVLTILTDDRAVKRVYTGQNGLLSAEVGGRLFIEMSTIRPQTILELYAAAQARSADLIDAPLSGSVGPARKGELLALVGGDAAAIERALPVLNTFCRRIERLGPTGSGATMKLVLNLPMAIYWQGLAEALAIGTQFGLPLEQMLTIFADSQVAIGPLRGKIPAILGASEDVWFDVSGVRKDLLAMVATGQELGVPMPAASAALSSFMQATAAGHGHEDLAAMIPYYLNAVSRSLEQRTPDES